MLNYFQRETKNGESLHGVAKLQNVLFLYMVSVLGKTQNVAISHGWILCPLILQVITHAPASLIPAAGILWRHAGYRFSSVEEKFWSIGLRGAIVFSSVT
jgi:hypothetical protein